MEDLGSRDCFSRQSYPRGGELESYYNRMWKPGTIPNENFCKEIASSMTDVQSKDLNIGDLSKLPIFRTDLESHANMVAVGRNVQIICNTNRTTKVSPFTPDYDSIHQIFMVDAAIRHNGEHNKKYLHDFSKRY